MRRSPLEPVYEAALQVATFTIGSGIFATVFGGAVKHFLNRSADHHAVQLDAQREMFKADLLAQLDGQRALHQRDAEAHKAALSKDAQVELVRLQAALREDAFRSETRFSRLHDSRASLIESLYSKLQRAEGAFRSFMSPLQQFCVDPANSRDEQAEAIRERTKQQAQEAIDAYNDLISSALPIRIYFEEATAEQMEALFKLMHGAIDDFTEYGLHYDDHSVAKEQRELRKKAWNTLNGEIQRLKRSLEKSFRGLLGVE